MNHQRIKIYFTSDWHCFHAKAIGFDKRPFKDVEEMHKSLIRRYNSTVGKDDVCYFLGDMGWGGAGQLKSVIDQLNGKKILILGNHDRGMNAMYNEGFDAVMYQATLYFAKEKVTLTHCPLRGVFREDVTGMYSAVAGENWHKETQHTKFSIGDAGQFHLHGHIHSPNGGKSEKILGRQYDVGVVANNYTPVSMSTIESWIFKTRKEENAYSVN